MAYDRWGHVVYAFALALVGSPPTAEAIVQTVYLTLWRKPEAALQGYVELPSFLFDAVVHSAREFHYGPPGPSHVDSALEDEVTSTESSTSIVQTPWSFPAPVARARRYSLISRVWRENA